MSSASKACPLCDSAHTESTGPIVHPNPPLVAGVAIDLGDQPFELLRCAACGYQFKYPKIDEQKLMDCYCAAGDAHWEESPDPRKRRFDEFAAIVRSFKPGGRMLDIGCFNGAMQSYLGNDWSHFGIEPSQGAADLAQQRGVEIIASTIDELEGVDDRFDVITAVDVIEHLPRPRVLFATVARLLSEGGVAVFCTGDSDALSWRLHGSRYWYCSLPEHVSFFNEQSMRHIADVNGLESLLHHRTSHIRARPDKRLRQAIRNGLFALTVRASCAPLGRLSRWAQKRPSPGWLAARDHMVHVIRKPDPASAAQ